MTGARFGSSDTRAKRENSARCTPGAVASTRWSCAEKYAVVVDSPRLPARAYRSAGSTADSHTSSDCLKLVTIVAIATISAKLATMPASPIAAPDGACASRVVAPSHGMLRVARLARPRRANTDCARRGCSMIAPSSSSAIAVYPMIGSPPSGGSSAATPPAASTASAGQNAASSGRSASSSDPAFSASAGSTRAASRAGAQPPATAAQTPSTKNATSIRHRSTAGLASRQRTRCPGRRRARPAPAPPGRSRAPDRRGCR